MAKRTSRGRQKIEMAKMKDESQKVYSFGHPSVHTIIERFLKDQKNPSLDDSSSPVVLTTMSATERIIHACRNARVQKMNQELMQLEKKLEAVKKGTEALEKAMKEDPVKQWWKRPIEEMDANQLMIYANKLEGLMMKVKKEMPLESIEGGTAPFTDLIGINDVYGCISLNANNFINQFCGRTEGGHVPGRHRPSVAGRDNLQKEIDLNRSPSPSRSGSLEKDDDHKKFVRVHQFI
ncbi:OLC1v1008870C1 [Oldenlandia corymbosa var. corymbosa]|uniref:OLC1v1008870C1 n=1 Tax=Oldenlandia corymbosa var. corymbosa TaxID=529605 RepID=A0AAV1DMH9_OLDCO|nr:OLC1v1008870C1 [Oldenlandia corymbosa var. corymbosa]